MRRRLLGYLAGKMGYELVRRDGAVIRSSSLALRDPEQRASPPDWLTHMRALLTHPASARGDAQGPGIPSIRTPLYFRSSLCTAVDFRNADFQRWRCLLNEADRLHRKIWEHVYIAAHVEAAGLLAPGRRGLGFGVGREPLPGAFARFGAAVTATDMDASDAARAGWVATDQHSGAAADLYHPALCDRADFNRLVHYETCDMRRIGGHLRNFDFCWSSCSLEHLGSIQAGCDFIRNSLETLRPGGVAVHTTEYNISSNADTIDHHPTLVIFRRQDIDRLVAELRAEGHYVAEVCYDVLSEPIDFFVDMPPHRADPHLRLAIGPYVCTSIGLVIEKRS